MHHKQGTMKIRCQERTAVLCHCPLSEGPAPGGMSLWVSALCAEGAGFSIHHHNITTELPYFHLHTTLDTTPTAMQFQTTPHPPSSDFLFVLHCQ